MIKVTRTGRSINSTRATTSTATTIGRGSEAIATVTAPRQNATPSATGRQRGIETATFTRGVPGALSPRGRGREIEMETAGEQDGTRARLKTQSHVDDDDGEDHARWKPTSVTGPGAKKAAAIRK